MRNVSDKIRIENQNTHAMFNNFFFSENCTIYDIKWTNILQPGRQQMTIWRMRTARCIPKTTNKHSHYVIIIAFPLQPWMHERS